ncbi:hypothetical protein FISHEDRAFT_67800 [Fistulina hepatica ATCC 64428]|nr:hypothetical protein FISHEDRAFT_67800 [Fistulina hepatica ATCC 64428]
MAFKPSSVMLFFPFTFLVSAAAGRLLHGQIKNLVDFGDSYSDVGSPADGGTAWPVYAAWYANVSLYSFARSGATCSNKITYRPYPSVFESQLPLFFEEMSNGSLALNSSSHPFNASDTLFTLWIGTNDVGANALLTGGGSASASVVETTRCAVSWVNVLYEHGARNFLFQNMIPLELTPLYAKNSYINRYWTDVRNTTAWHVSIRELALAGNALAELMLHTLVPSMPDAHIGLFDSHALFSDMYYHPARYLNGTAPLNVIIPAKSCVYKLHESTSDTGICTWVNGTARDSYLWYDELHPSEQADRIVAREISKIIAGNFSSWATWLS